MARSSYRWRPGGRAWPALKEFCQPMRAKFQGWSTSGRAIASELLALSFFIYNDGWDVAEGNLHSCLTPLVHIAVDGFPANVNELVCVNARYQRYLSVGHIYQGVFTGAAGSIPHQEYRLLIVLYLPFHTILISIITNLTKQILNYSRGFGLEI